MTELIQKLVSKVGINEEQAQGAIETVVEFVKSKIPESFHQHLDGAVSGAEGEGGGAMDSAKNALGGLLGGSD